MQKSRRDFVKKASLVTASLAAGASVSALANDKKEDTSGVVKGSSRKKEILYKKTLAWEEYYENAK